MPLSGEIMGFLFPRFQVYDVVGSLAHDNLYGEDVTKCVMFILKCDSKSCKNKNAAFDWH